MRKRAELKDQTGFRSGRWVVVEFSHYGKRSGEIYWRCRCDCGAEKAVLWQSLRRGLSKSCGCYNVYVLRTRSQGRTRKHGMAYSATYRSWLAMKDRCMRPKHQAWHNYGGRGIEVCQRWLRFKPFLRDMGERPNGTTLERLDTNGNYEPGNCVWATLEVQHSNKRTSRKLTIDGETLTMAQWARRVGIGETTIRERLGRGWSSEDAVRVAPLKKGLEFLNEERASNAKRPKEIAPSHGVTARPVSSAAGGQINVAPHVETQETETAAGEAVERETEDA